MTAFETPQHVALRIGVPAGEVVVEVVAEPRVEVELVALRDNDATRQLLAETRVEKLDRPGGHEVVVQAPKKSGFNMGRGPKIGVRIRCPHGSDLSLRSGSADLDAAGALGAVEVKTGSGDVSLQEATSVDVHSASGDVDVRDVVGGVNVTTASGDVRVGRCGGKLNAGLVSGDLSVGEAALGLSVTTVSGDVDVRSAGGGDIRVQAVSGDVRIAVRPGERLYIDASSVSGSMSSEFDVADGPSAESDSDAGGPVLELRARTVSGDVAIVRASGVGA